MKKRKTIFLTVVAIGVFRVLMLAGANIVADNISTGNETNNTLSANVRQTGSDDTVFDYPYIETKDYSKYPQIPVTTPIRDIFDIINMEESKPSEDMISYQQVANICGEAIKYLFGYTGHSKDLAVIGYYVDTYRYYFLSPDETMAFEIYVNPVTGKIHLFVNQKNVFVVPDITTITQFNKDVKTVSDEIKEKLIKNISEILDVLNIEKDKDNIVFTEFEYLGNTYGVEMYRAYFTISDNEKYGIFFNTNDNEFFELESLWLSDR